MSYNWCDSVLLHFWIACIAVVSISFLVMLRSYHETCLNVFYVVFVCLTNQLPYQLSLSILPNYSAGFDGYVSDPLGGQLCLSLEDYQTATKMVRPPVIP
jgi:hypothetical protein